MVSFKIKIDPTHSESINSDLFIFYSYNPLR